MGYRTDFENLLKGIFDSINVKRIDHDARAKQGNKPDFVVLKNDVPILYIEAKDIGISLDKVEKSEQMARYFGYDNLVLTDYVEFRFYRNGMKYGEPVSIAKINQENRTLTSLSDNFSLLNKTLLDFSTSHKEPIKSGVHLARIMGGKAQRIRDNVREMLLAQDNRYGDLVKIKDVVKENLVTGLDDESFSDMYAQTLVYGLFAARYNDPTSETFSRSEARELVPKTNPFLRSFFDHIAGTSFPERLRYIVDELCEAFTHSDIDKILHDFYGKEKDSKDPIIHFYEDFLREYDAKKKVEMGVFYTPLPVVNFIMRAVDSLLKSEFGLTNGLADTTKIRIERSDVDHHKAKRVKIEKEYHKVQILDVATGTGTFLKEVINHIYAGFENQEGRWPAYVKNDLLPRIHGFELMMASYTIAHLKLGITLRDTGANNLDTRIGVYLTNTLGAPVDYSNQGTLFGLMESIAEESKSASRIKSEYPIMCVIGNPPYSGISMNKHYTDNNVYKVEPGGLQKLQERKNWLDDDYVKFIRFAESLIEKNGEGIVGMITAHGYIDNPTFRGMRWHLRKTFDSIHVIDLHGNSNKKETSPDGSKDENIFDIKTGVSIILAVKKQGNVKDKKPAQIYKTDFFGTRESKYEKLDAESVETIKWKTLPENTEVWRIEGKGKNEYQEGFSVAELFSKIGLGIVTARDQFVIDWDRDQLHKRILDFSQISSEEARLKYNLRKDVQAWKVSWAQKDVKETGASLENIQKIQYRIFDSRYIYYTEKSSGILARPNGEIMKNFVNKENVGLITNRQVKAGAWKHVFLSSSIVESSFISNKTGEIGSIFPLYIYTEQGDKAPNLDKAIWEKINEIVGHTTPENVFDYIYAILHSPNYREKYKEFLKIDFPRVLYPKDAKSFKRLVSLGGELRQLHLLELPKVNKFITTYSVAGSNEVEKLVYKDGKVFINKDQYFGGVPDVAWIFYIGGYQPAQKWLKDRKGRILTNEDIEHYQKIIVALTETDRIMKEIDEKNYERD